VEGSYPQLGDGLNLADDDAEHVELVVRQETGPERAVRLEVTELVPERS
jgi:hypothetical protein